MYVDLKAIRERAEKATPGPWETIEESEWKLGYGMVYCSDDTGSAIAKCHMPLAGRSDLNTINNAEFIAHTRQDIPALLDYIDKLETERKKITEIIARNCTAWDTSKDKSMGLLPEVVLSNHVLYKQLTGEDYNFRKTCQKFNIGEW